MKMFCVLAFERRTLVFLFPSPLNFYPNILDTLTYTHPRWRICFCIWMCCDSWRRNAIVTKRQDCKINELELQGYVCLWVCMGITIRLEYAIIINRGEWLFVFNFVTVWAHCADAKRLWERKKEWGREREKKNERAGRNK